MRGDIIAALTGVELVKEVPDKPTQRIVISPETAALLADRIEERLGITQPEEPTQPQVTDSGMLKSIQESM